MSGRQGGVRQASPVAWSDGRPTYLSLADDQLRAWLKGKRDEFSHHRALVDGAQLCEDLLDLFERYVATRDQALVTPAEGEAISGYHREHLTRLIRQGRIPDLRPVGSKGHILIPLSALPLKPGRSRPQPRKMRRLAERMFGSGSKAKGDVD